MTLLRTESIPQIDDPCNPPPSPSMENTSEHTLHFDIYIR